MTHSADFWDKIADKYSKDPIADEAAYQKKLEITRSYLEPHWEALELGCGTGSTALLHSDHLQTILATDISWKMIEIAKQKADDQKIHNVTFERWDVDAFDADDQSFDVVFALSLLHLVEDKEALMAKIFKWLRPGGIFVSSTACLRDMNFLLPLAIPLAQLIGKAPRPVKSFSEKQLAESIKNAGFTIEEQWKPKKGAAVFIIGRKIG